MGTHPILETVGTIYQEILVAAMLPHVVLITCHDLGRFLGCYGVATVQSPNLDRLAGTGVRLARAFTTAPSCSPARTALATGRYPHATGVVGLTHPPFHWDMHAEERHVAAILGDAGYSTHLFGFQHVSPRDERPGFQHVHIDNNRGLAASVSQQVAALLTGAQQAQPLYVEINLEEPHRPYEQGDAVPDRSLGVTVPGYLPQGPESKAEIAALQGAIRQADLGIGAILDALDRAGLTDNTLVLFSADHGLAMPRAKCTLYDPGIEIAVLLRWPSRGIGGGRVLEDLVSNVDLLPTLLALIGLPVPERMQGHSFAPALRGEPHTARAAIFAEKTYHSYYDPMRAIRTQRSKLIRNWEPTFRVEIPADMAQGAIFRAHVERYYGGQHPPVELYDLEADPLEQRNLAGLPQWAEVQVELETTLNKWMQDSGDPLAGRGSMRDVSSGRE